MISVTSSNHSSSSRYISHSPEALKTPAFLAAAKSLHHLKGTTSVAYFLAISMEPSVPPVSTTINSLSTCSRMGFSDSIHFSIVSILFETIKVIVNFISISFYEKRDDFSSLLAIQYFILLITEEVKALPD